MENLPTFVQLAQLENKFMRGVVPLAEYKSLKWGILQQAFDNGEAVEPLYKGKRQKEIADSRGANFCYVPPGPFIYGPDNAYGELNAGIYIGKYAVTVREFKEFLDGSGWAYPDEDRKLLEAVSPHPDCPASHLSWADAKQYCRWLRSITNEYYSLPYESEWEYASRGVDGRRYPWGNDSNTAANACYLGELEYPSTTSVKKFLDNKSPFGCIGMAGNVWEWCLDEFDDPIDPHILRGGAWCHEAEYLICTSRVSLHPPENRVDYAGLRLVYLPGEMYEEYQQSILGDAAS